MQPQSYQEEKNAKWQKKGNANNFLALNNCTPIVNFMQLGVKLGIRSDGMVKCAARNMKSVVFAKLCNSNRLESAQLSSIF